jgi:hypothetical protein
MTSGTRSEKGELESFSMKRCSPILASLALCLALLSCEPVFAIGWPELVTLVVIIVILLGPLMFRIYRFLDKIQKATKAEEKKKK